MRVTLIFISLGLLLVYGAGWGQDCPRSNPSGPSFDSTSRTLTGRLEYHDDLRQWFGLKLDAPVCGVAEVQELEGGGAFEVDEGNARTVEIYRGCRVRITGSLGIPGTGYYSAEIYQNVEKIEPEAGCVLKPHLPNYDDLKPRRSVRSYRVEMRLDYRPNGGPIRATAFASTAKLTPWQVYAHFFLTGGYVLYASCADGFELSRMRGTRAAKPWIIDNRIALDPETAAATGATDLRLSYTCRR